VLLDYLESIMPDDMTAVILADREFGSVDRLEYAAGKGWDYAIRLKGNVRFYMPNLRQTLMLSQIAPQTGTQYALTDIRITKANFYPTHLTCAWALGSDEPWLIATNLAQPIRALKEYRRRFGCEELFSDLKKRGSNWEDRMIRAADRFSRWLLALALLTIFLLELGRYVHLNQSNLELVSPSHQPPLEPVSDRSSVIAGAADCQKQLVEMLTQTCCTH
jgi:hypothetical protein